MEKVASIFKYRGHRDKLVRWMSQIPVKGVAAFELSKIIDDIRENNFVIWTENSGFKVVK